ncbi:MAG: hypothetical protein IJM57_00695 [Lachnospiraceae bacterium]|nr:hypothetical protein [Lachnospiraceae bacterium]
MEYNHWTEEYRIPAEEPMNAPEIAFPAPEYPENAPETPEMPAEYETIPRGGLLRTDGAFAEPSEQERAESERKAKRRFLLHNFAAPVAATIVIVAICFASFNYDPLGNNYLMAGFLKSPLSGNITEVGVKPEVVGDVTPTPTPTPTNKPSVTPTPTPPLKNYAEGSIPAATVVVRSIVHVESESNGSFDSQMTEGDPMPEIREWLATWGGDPNTMTEVSRMRTFLGYEFSDDLIMIGDTDDMANIYIAQGYIHAVYREEIEYFAYPMTSTPGGDTGDADWPSLPNMAPDFAGAYAWGTDGTEEYVRMRINGETYDRYLEMGSAWAAYGGAMADVPGASYDSSTNTLTLTDCTADVLDVNLMGNGFTVKLVGDNRIGYISIWGAMYGGSVTITGTGTLTVNESRANNVGLMLEAERSAAVLMVDRGVKVDLYGKQAAFLASTTTMEQAVWYRPGMTLTGGTRTSGEFLNRTRTLTDENGYVLFDENGNIMQVPVTLAEISQAYGVDLYDYTFVNDDGSISTEVHFDDPQR